MCFCNIPSNLQAHLCLVSQSARGRLPKKKRTFLLTLRHFLRLEPQRDAPHLPPPCSPTPGPDTLLRRSALLGPFAPSCARLIVCSRNPRPCSSWTSAHPARPCAWLRLKRPARRQTARRHQRRQRPAQRQPPSQARASGPIAAIMELARLVCTPRAAVSQSP